VKCAIYLEINLRVLGVSVYVLDMVKYMKIFTNVRYLDFIICDS